MLREELQRELLRGRAGLRAVGYEERIRRGEGGTLVRRCWEEIKSRVEKEEELSGWERERVEFYGRRGVEIKVDDEEENLGEGKMARLVEKKKEMQSIERWERIKSSKFNMWYWRVKGKGVPGYLKKGWGEERWQRIARYRLGNGMKGSKYWEEEEEWKCRMCELKEENWKHVWEEGTE